MSATGVMGQSIVYNADTGVVVNGTFLPSGAALSVNGTSFFNNFNLGTNYNLLSIDFGENKGFGYNSDTNEIFIANNTSSKIPVKIDTDAPTDSFNILSTGGIKMANIPSGTIASTIGLDSNNDLVKGTVASQFADNESITSAGFTNTITPTSSTEYAYTFASFDRSAPVGTTYEFEFGAVIVWQNATNINDFRTVINITSNLGGILPLVPTATSFPNHYVFKVTVTRTNDAWVQIANVVGGSSQIDSRTNYSITTSTTYTGSITPKLGLETPASAFTTGDLIRFLYMKKTRIK